MGPASSGSVALSDRSSGITGLIADPFYGFKEKEGVIDLNFNYGYKVFRFIGLCPPGISVEVEIFSSQTQEWVKSSVPKHPSMSYNAFYGTHHVISNRGMVYWWQGEVTYDIELRRHRVRGNLIIYDPLKNCFHLIGRPDDVLPEGVNLGSCRGRVRMVHKSSFIPDAPDLRVWELVDYNLGNWKLVYEVNVKDMVSKDVWLTKKITAGHLVLDEVFIHPEDGELLYILFQRRVTVFNIYTMTLTSLYKTDPFFFSTWGSFSPLQLQYWPIPIVNSQTGCISTASDSTSS